MAAGAALRFACLGAQSIWYDEAVSARLAGRGMWDLLSGRAKDLGNPPLHALVLHGWQQLFGGGDRALRAVSALAGALSIPLVFSIGRRTVGERAALWAAALFAASPFQVYLSQEARTYALVTLLVLLGFQGLLVALERPERRRWWALYAIATFLALLAHYYAFFVVLAQLLYVLAFHRERSRIVPMAAALAAVALAYLVWVPAFYAQLTTKGNLSRSADTWYLHGLSSPLVFATGTTLVWKGLGGPLRYALAAAAIGALATGALAGLRALGDRRSARALLLLWLLVPVGLPLLVSATLFPFYTVRYALLATPAYVLLVAAGLTALRPAARAAAAGALAAAFALSLATYFTTQVKTDWRAAAAWVDAHAEPGDLLLFDIDYNELPFSRYARGPGAHLRLLAEGDPTRLYAVTRAGEQPRDVTAEVLAAPRVWFVESDGDPGFERRWEARLAQGHTKAARTRFRGVDVDLWERPR